MPEKSKHFHGVRFTPDQIAPAADQVVDLAAAEARKTFGDAITRDVVVGAVQATRQVSVAGETWSFDSDAEFYGRLRGDYTSAKLTHAYPNMTTGTSVSLGIEIYGASSQVHVRAPAVEDVERVFEEFERAVDVCRVPLPPDDSHVPRVFVGHGGDPQWRDLKDHLQDVHDYEVIAYETGARGGLNIQGILSEMLRDASFAVLVMTGEDETADGELRARQNVVHEIGLFQGKLGFARAVVLVEDGVEGFSNLQGTHEIRFPKGRIRETFGDVLGALHREFGRAPR